MHVPRRLQSVVGPQSLVIERRAPFCTTSVPPIPTDYDRLRPITTDYARKAADSDRKRPITTDYDRSRPETTAEDFDRERPEGFAEALPDLLLDGVLEPGEDVTQGEQEVWSLMEKGRCS